MVTDSTEAKVSSPARLVLLTVLWLVICFTAAGVGSWLTSDAVSNWYTTIEKPTWNPPDWIFPVVWTTLFAMMGFAAGRIHAGRGYDATLVLFSFHLVLNVLWSCLFFYYHQIFWAAVEILILEASIIATLMLFWKQDRWAGMLLVPYALWVGFASFLNWTIVSLNS